MVKRGGERIVDVSYNALELALEEFTLKFSSACLKKHASAACTGVVWLNG